MLLPVLSFGSIPMAMSGVLFLWFEGSVEGEGGGGWVG